MDHRDAGVRLAWGLALLLLAANVAGYAFDLYSAFGWFDRALHAATILALTFWLATIPLRGAVREGREVAFIVLIAGLGIALGALWEVAEWAYDAIAPGNVIKGKDDTLLDVVMDTLGAVAAAFLARLYRTGEAARVR